MQTLGEFARSLTDAQKARKVSIHELARETGLSRLAVRQILAGDSAPRLTNAMALASALGLELVLMPKEAAQSLAATAAAEAKRTVLSDVERRLNMNVPASSSRSTGN